MLFRSAEEQRQIAVRESEYAKLQTQRMKEQRKIAERQRRLAIVLAVVAVIGLAIALWFYIDANKAKHEANENLSAALKAKVEAEKQTSIANIAKAEADSSSRIAIKKTEEAIKSEQKAKESLAEAEKQKHQRTLIEVNKHITSAKRMRDAGDKEMARQILEKALELDKNNAEVLKMLNEIEKN